VGASKLHLLPCFEVKTSTVESELLASHSNNINVEGVKDASGNTSLDAGMGMGVDRTFAFAEVSVHSFRNRATRSPLP
jgi:hypothetical protein